MSALPCRLTRAVRSWRARAMLSRSYQTLPPPTPYDRLLAQRELERIVLWDASNQGGSTYCLLPAALAGIFGAGSLQMVYADSMEGAEGPVPSPSEGRDLEQIAKDERARVTNMMRSKGQPHGFIPRFSVAVKGQRVSLKFQVPPACEVSQLITILVSKLGLKAEEPSGGSDMLLRGWESTVAWQLTLNPLERSKNAKEGDSNSSISKADGDLCIFIFRSLISKDKAEIEFLKSGSLSAEELEAFVSILQVAGGNLGREHDSFKGTPRGSDARKAYSDKTIASLESMGVKIYGLDQPQMSSRNMPISWDNIAGYDKQKREIEDTVLLALKSPDIYDDIARGTRQKFESNRPRAVLFEGPPGTGKTSCARVIATQAGVPLLYVPLEIVMSKYYGESERLLGQVFSLANELPNGGIIFLDEVDSFAVARDNEIHEATRRVLSVLLRQIDGFEQDKKVVVIAATNRKQDLDPALISRFDSMITFGIPDLQNRQEIATQYAKHLKEQELAEFARVTEEMSGRDIRDVCQHAERSWASKIIRGEENNEEQVSLPPLKEYIESAINRRNVLLTIADEKNREPKPGKQKLRLDLG
ncbi:hypothetical protein MLD38_019424 [Melastoma candidum]|uniref:Uncharacterized protein n=1 Tax=Melastoma candidum TaxID=119954 RepID=A0ACB9QWW6_9MYRT|nr:hypothetical protein MLD38_019424 [Melastoma candidum]